MMKVNLKNTSIMKWFEAEMKFIEISDYFVLSWNIFMYAWQDQNKDYWYTTQMKEAEKRSHNSGVLKD